MGQEHSKAPQKPQRPKLASYESIPNFDSEDLEVLECPELNLITNSKNGFFDMNLSSKMKAGIELENNYLVSREVQRVAYFYKQGTVEIDFLDTLSDGSSYRNSKANSPLRSPKKLARLPQNPFLVTQIDITDTCIFEPKVCELSDPSIDDQINTSTAETTPIFPKVIKESSFTPKCFNLTVKNIVIQIPFQISKKSIDSRPQPNDDKSFESYFKMDEWQNSYDFAYELDLPDLSSLLYN